MARMHSVVVAAACVAAVVGLSACSKSDDKKSDSKDDAASASSSPQQEKPRNELANLSAKEISDKAKHELLSATSVRMKMDQPTGPQAMKLDLALDSKGDCAGTISATEGSAEIIKLGDKVWMKPDEKFMKAQGNPAAAELFKGRYIHGSTKDEMLKGMAEMCNLKGFQQQIGKDSGDDDKGLTKGETATVNGQQVVTLIEKGGEQTLTIAATGKPYPVTLTKKGKEAGTMTFSDWGKPVPSKTPAPSEVIDVDKLKKSMGS